MSETAQYYSRLKFWKNENLIFVRAIRVGPTVLFNLWELTIVLSLIELWSEMTSALIMAPIMRKIYH